MSLATGIFVSIVNIFLSLLSLFGGGRPEPPSTPGHPRRLGAGCDRGRPLALARFEDAAPR